MREESYRSRGWVCCSACCAREVLLLRLSLLCFPVCNRNVALLSSSLASFSLFTSTSRSYPSASSTALQVRADFLPSSSHAPCHS